MIKINKLLKKHQNDWNQVLKEARSLEASGELGDAITVYEAFLGQQPSHPDILESLATASLKAKFFSKSVAAFNRLIKQIDPMAHHFLHRGIAEAQLGQQDEALISFQEALNLKPDYPLAHNNLGKLYGDIGKPQAALESYQAAIALDSTYLDAWLNQGVTLQSLGRFEEALAALREALQLDPDHTKAFFHEAVVLQSLGHIDDETTFQRLQDLIVRDPGLVDAINELGLWYKAKGQKEDALQAFERALSIDSRYPPGHINRGMMLNESRRYEEALAAFDRAILLNPRLAEAYVNRATTLARLDVYEEALKSANEAIALKPDLAEAHSNRGLALGRMQRIEEALSAFARAIDLKPDLVGAFIDRSELLRRLGKINDALRDSRKALELDPLKTEPHINLALTLMELHDLDAAVAALDQALKIDVDSADAQFNKGIVNLLRGQLLNGAYGYEWRWKGPLRKFAPRVTQPLWLGEEALEGKTILVSSEQGLGDHLQYVRFLPFLAAQAREVIVEVPAPLLPLFKTLEGRYRFVERGRSLPRADVYCPLMSLPLAFKTELSSIPTEIPYLHVPEDRLVLWRDRLGVQEKPRIGLAFSGNLAHANDQNRSIPLQDFARILSKDYEFHVIQKDIRAADAEFLEASGAIQTHAEALETFLDTAALLMHMDLIISVDTSLVHLAGALGRPVWPLLTYLPDFRWLLDRVDSPWYPTARLFRQTERRDWGEVLTRVQEALVQTFPQG